MTISTEVLGRRCKIISFLLSLALKTQVNRLGPKRLSRTVAHLHMVVDPLVGKNSLQYLWACLHPRAIQLQWTNLFNFPGTQCPVGSAPPLGQGAIGPECPFKQSLAKFVTEMPLKQ